MSKVSIIIPCYRQAQFLAATIESALAQTHRDLEVIVIDDGSPDHTAEVAARYASDPRFRYLRQENTGLPGARNRGLAETTGEYVCFLDSDDLLLPDKCRRQVEVLAANPKLGFVYCDITTIDEKGIVVPDQFSIAAVPRDLSGNLFGTLIQGGYFPPHTVMVRRSVLEAVGGFDPALGGHADYELWLRISGAGYPAHFIAERLASYRVHSASMSKDGRHMRDTRIATLNKIARLYPEQFGPGVDRLQQSIEDLFAANLWLRKQQEEAVVATAALPAGDGEVPPGLESYPFMRNLGKAKRGKGKENQSAIWDVSIDGRHDRGIYMQPPIDLTFRVPTGKRGRFLTAVCVHPLAWEKPNAGGCEFHVRIDGRVAHIVALDPVHIVADRHWHELAIDVPERADGCHEVYLEVRPSGGSTAYRWGIWRTPKFVYASEVVAEAPVPATSRPATPTASLATP